MATLYAGGRVFNGQGRMLDHHGENARELEYMVEVGIKPIDALTISTGNAAGLMRLDERGRIAEGCHADLLVVEGDPVSEIRAVAERRNHRWVIKNSVAVIGPPCSGC